MYRSLLAGAAVALALSTPAFAASYNTLSGETPLVIAHRGASGYLPEHTLAAYELAIQMGADIVEPDLQTTKDGVLIAMHDSTLNRTTDVETVLGMRNGGYNVSEYTYAEIQQLTVEPPANSTASTSYPGYTPSMADPFKIPTFAEVMAFVNAHNSAAGDTIGIYPEAKTPNSTAMNQQILNEMQAAGFVAPEDHAILQTFSHAGARELAELQALMGMDNTIAVLGSARLTADGYGLYDSTTRQISLLTDLALFADGLGVSLSGSAMTADFIKAAHDLGMTVHGWTFNIADRTAAYEQYEKWVDAGMDGIFTNYTDLAVDYLAERNEASPVPLPAGLPLLLAGLGGFAVLRRRKA